jgi:hypothetical protein
MVRKHFETRAELERQMDAARQLRAEILGGAIATWIVSALAGAVSVTRRTLLLIVSRGPHQA